MTVVHHASMYNDGGGGTEPLPTGPVIDSISPTSIPNSVATTVTVNGSGFAPDSAVIVNMQAPATTYVSSIQLTFSHTEWGQMTVPLSVMQSDGAGGWDQSNTIQLQIT